MKLWFRHCMLYLGPQGSNTYWSRITCQLGDSNCLVVEYVSTLVAENVTVDLRSHVVSHKQSPGLILHHSLMKRTSKRYYNYIMWWENPTCNMLIQGTSKIITKKRRTNKSLSCSRFRIWWLALVGSLVSQVPCLVQRGNRQKEPAPSYKKGHLMLNLEQLYDCYT